MKKNHGEITSVTEKTEGRRSRSDTLRFAFRLSHLFVLISAVAVWFAVLRVSRNLAITLAVSVAPGIVTTWILIARRSRHGVEAGLPRKLVLLLETSIVWFIVYVLSIGPAVAIIFAANIDTTAAEIFYGPVIWLHDNTILKELLEAYASLWGWS